MSAPQDDINSLDFDSVAPIWLPVRYGGKDYVLCEATGGAVATFRNAVNANVRTDADGKPSRVDNSADLIPLLVSLCVSPRDPAFRDQVRPTFDRHGALMTVPLTQVKTWTNKVLTKLFHEAFRISEVDDVGGGADAIRQKIAKLQEQLDKLEADSPKDGPPA